MSRFFRDTEALGLPMIGARQHYLAMRRRNPLHSDTVWFGVFAALGFLLGATGIGTGALWP